MTLSRVPSLRFVKSVILASAIVFAVAPAALAETAEYRPEVYQGGKDVVWVPTAQDLVDKMLDMAHVTPADYVIDLGSGDGRTVITAARRGVRAHGIEYNPDMVELSKRRAAEAGVSDRATFEKADIFESDFSKASVITLFLLPALNEKLRPTILDLKPGTRVVSNTFPMGDWQPDETTSVGGEDCSSWCSALLWIVPAKVEGTWQLGGQELNLAQRYQMLSGKLGGSDISEARMKGNEISFMADGVRYAGVIDGRTMKGTRRGASEEAWSATRK